MTSNAIIGRVEPAGGSHTVLLVALFGVLATTAAAAALWPPAAIVAVVLLVAVVGLKYPMGVGATLIVAGVLFPDYIGAHIQGSGVVLHGRLLLSLLLLYVGLIATRANRSSHVRHVQWAVVILAGIWLLSAFVASSGDIADRLQTTTYLALPDVAALVGATLLACAPGGRRRLLLALTIAGVVAAGLAVTEFLTQRNPLLELGLTMDLGADEWKKLPLRFGLARSAGAFGHPIELGVVLGMCLIATLESARVRALPTGVAMAAAGIMFAGQLTTISRGPILGTLAAVALWTVWARPINVRWRVATFVVVVGLTFAAVSQANVESGLAGFIDTGEETENMGGTAEHRLMLTESFLQELASPSLAGTLEVTSSTVGREFVTIDHEGLYLLVGRGLVGLAVFGVLLLFPVVYDLRRIGLGVTREPHATLSAVYLIVTGATVAFFGPLQTYMWVTIAIMWSTVALASEIPGERVAGHTFRDEDVSMYEPLGVFRV